MRTSMQPNVSEMFDRTAQTLGAAMQTGARLQGEAMRWWAGMFQEASALEGMQRRTRAMMSEMIPGARKNASQYLVLLAHTYHRNLDLLRRTLEAGQSRSYGEAQRRLLDLWRASLGALQSDAQELAQVNTRVMKTLSEAAEHNLELATEAARSGAQAAGQSAQSATRRAASGAPSSLKKASSARQRGRAASARSRKRR